MQAQEDSMGAFGVSWSMILTDTRFDEAMEKGFAIQIRSVSELLPER
jgi:hypothetical protein